MTNRFSVFFFADCQDQPYIFEFTLPQGADVYPELSGFFKKIGIDAFNPDGVNEAKGFLENEPLYNVSLKRETFVKVKEAIEKSSEFFSPFVLMPSANNNANKGCRALIGPFPFAHKTDEGIIVKHVSSNSGLTVILYTKEYDVSREQ